MTASVPPGEAYRPSNFGSLPITAVMAEQIVHLAPTATLTEVAAAMIDGDVGLVVLTTGEEYTRAEIAGVISERDLAAAIATGKPLDTAAGDVATTSIVWCEADASVADAAYEMLQNYVRHVLVEDGSKLVGVVSARDLLGVFTAEATAT